MSLLKTELLIVFCLLALPGCDRMTNEEKVVDQMEWLYTAKPDHDVQVALEKKDYRFMGIYGTTLVVPGIDFSCISLNKDVKPIQGTSDVVLGDEHQKLIGIAGEYARDFNQKMLVFRIEKLGFKCCSKP
jgi:hypothetical protein